MATQSVVLVLSFDETTIDMTVSVDVEGDEITHVRVRHRSPANGADAGTFTSISNGPYDPRSGHYVASVHEYDQGGEARMTSNAPYEHWEAVNRHLIIHLQPDFGVTPEHTRRFDELISDPVRDFTRHYLDDPAFRNRFPDGSRLRLQGYWDQTPAATEPDIVDGHTRIWIVND